MFYVAHVRILQEELDQERHSIVKSNSVETCSAATVENINQMQQEMERESVRNQGV